jgi:hypothetical protein
MTAQRLTARTTACDLGRLVLVERKGLRAASPARAPTSRNEPERSATSEQEPRFTNGGVRA